MRQDRVHLCEASFALIVRWTAFFTVGARLVWWSGDAAPAFVQARSGDALVLCGHFPVARAANLRVQLKGTRETLDLSATDVDGGVRIDIPAQATTGDWRLVIGAIDALAAPLEITTVRVM